MNERHEQQPTEEPAMISIEKVVVKNDCKRCMYNALRVKTSISQVLNYQCDVGVKSLIRSLAQFYRQKLQSFTK